MAAAKSKYRASDGNGPAGGGTGGHLMPALALRVAELGLVRYPKSAVLSGSRTRSLTTLRQINSQMNPFRFIVYSEWSGRSLAPVSPQ